jgi:diguanylate cyclase (GGDEF)-like protein
MTSAEAIVSAPLSAAAALPTRRPVPWYALAALCLAGTLVGGTSLLLPHTPSADMPARWRNVALAGVVGVVALALARRAAPMWLTHVFLVGGTYIVSNAIYQSGDGSSPYAIWYIWVALYAFSFYRRRAAVAHLAIVAAAYAGVLAVLDADEAVGRWVTTVSTLLIAASFVSYLVRGLRRHAAVVERLMEQLQEAAQTDELTGLPNRRAWQATLERELAHARRFEMPLAIAVLDLDGFKVLNDREGHAAGDAMLRSAAARWSDVVRDVDTLARWGGDEFGLIVPGSDVDGAREVVERVRAQTPAGATCSAGLVVWDGVEDQHSIMARADAALYEAKRTGRDRLVVGARCAALA